MNQTHLHLLINHLPIFGSILGSIVLTQAIWTKNDQTKIAAYNLFIISSVGAIITFITGESAEETVENMTGILKSSISSHAEFAVFALASLIILGIASIGGIFMTLGKSSNANSLSKVILIISVISFLLAARTGYLGGKIRHTEINSSNNYFHQLRPKHNSIENDLD